MTVLAGCSSDRDMPPLENGWHVDAVNGRQRDKGAADERVLYRYEWQGDMDAGPAVLTEYGGRHLHQIARSVAGVRQVVVIEPSGDVATDAARRQCVVDALAQLDVPDPAALVRIDRPAAYGTPGEEAANIDADTPRGGQTNGTTGGNGLGGGFGGASSLGSGGLGGLRGGGL